jgi:hypothetical protein
MRNDYPYRNGGRFQTPNSQGQIENPYDQDSRLFQDLEQRGLLPVRSHRLNLTTAGSLYLADTGFHFVQFGDDNSSIRTVNTTSYVEVWINAKSDNGSPGFPAKHARGFSGPFSGLFLSWPAQNNVYCTFIIFKGAEKPWIDGESAT